MRACSNACWHITKMRRWWRKAVWPGTFQCEKSHTRKTEEQACLYRAFKGKFADNHKNALYKYNNLGYVKYLLNDKVEYVHHKKKDLLPTKYYRADSQSDKFLYSSMLRFRHSTVRRLKCLTAWCTKPIIFALKILTMPLAARKNIVNICLRQAGR